MISKLMIISGGQSGVDRAALDFAQKNKVNSGGWCPKGRKAEDGTIDEKYPLDETTDSSYENRTKFNVRDSDGTLILFITPMDAGTRLTFKLAQEMNKPVLVIDLSENKDARHHKVHNWIHFNHLEILNIAGPRESNSPGIYAETMEFLEELFFIKYS
ncbi:MAG: putative molybdenum carrier protein [Bacteroidales bacterium]|nr:putative molybdenum carrier protein [Bacteroidales bacterium]